MSSLKKATRGRTGICFVTIRVPQVIPGVATIEIRSTAPDVRAISVVSMTLTGPGSEHPPKPDLAVRSDADPQFLLRPVCG